MGITNRAEIEIDTTIITISEEEKNKIISDEESNKDTSNPYRQQLLKINNPFADWDLEIFYTNHSKRLKGYSKNIASTELYTTYLHQFLDILTDIEQDPEVQATADQRFVTSKSYLNISSANSSLFRKATYGGVSRYWMYKYQSTRLPHCCGVSEYGDFAFAEFAKVPAKLIHNLMLDLIRLTAHVNRKSHSGATSIINYFVETPFMTTLLTRDDLQFIKVFTNPKTGATLNMFMFDTKL